jgi:hypothetical protein
MSCLIRHGLLSIVLSLILMTSTSAQTVVFKVITFSQGVMIDKRPAHLGMDVNTWHHNVVIPDGGYLGLITFKGFPLFLKQSVPVGEVSDLADKVHDAFENRSFSRDMRPHDWLDMNLMGGFLDNSKLMGTYTDMIGDSLFMYWTTWDPFGSKNRKLVKTDYEFTITDQYERELLTRNVSSNWVLVTLPDKEEVRTAYETDTFLFQVKSSDPKQGSDPILLKFADKRRIMNALYQLDEIPRDENRYFYQCAMYQLMNLKLDMHLPVYHILKEKRKSTDPILQKYFEVLAADFRFDLIDFER